MAINILIDGRKLGDGGIGVYIENLIDGLLSLNVGEPLGLTMLVRPELCRPEGETTPDCITRWRNEVKFVAEKSGKYSAREYLLLASKQRSVIEQHDVFHSPHYTLPYSIPIPKVVTIHDIIHVSNPDTIAHRVLGKALIRSAVSRADRLITVSQASAEQIIRLAGEASAKLSVIPNAVRIGLDGESFEKLSKSIGTRKVPNNYCLFVGSERPHKGFSELIDAWKQLRGAFSRLDKPLPHLVVVGSGFSRSSEQRVERAGLNSEVHFFKAASASDLTVLYRGASAAVVPSHEEGFGLVALEAMACGVPVVCSPLACLKEVCGDVAWYSEDLSSNAIFQALQAALLKKSAADEKVSVGLARARRFSLERQAKETFGVYDSVRQRAQTSPFLSKEAETIELLRVNENSFNRGA